MIVCWKSLLDLRDTHLNQFVVSHSLIDITELLLHLLQVIISFEPKQTNRVTHCLVNFANELSVNQVWLTSVSEFVQDALAYDCNPT